MVEAPQKILIVDDEKIYRDQLSLLLKDQYKLMVANDGEQALKAIAHVDSKPDLILLDVMMPNMDGYEVCKRVKNDDACKDIPVIFITSMEDVKDETKGFELGAVDYITKPISPPIVQARVKTHMRLKRKIDLLENMVSLDGLTEIPNRRAFDETLKKEWELSKRNSTTMSVIMMDVDKFKQFNDNYGHSAGDDCLKKVAEALAGASKRPADFVARYGGEEFCAILPDTNLEGALNVAEGFRKAVEGLNIPHEYSEAAKFVTVSIGVASSSSSGDLSGLELQKFADKQLYLAKETGRNQVVGDNL